MSEQNITSGEDLIKGIIKGRVPRQVRLFAAQGLLPVSREDLLSLQVLLSADPDEELAKVAADSLKAEKDETLIAWLRGTPPSPLVLDLLIRVRNDETLWAVVAANPNVSDETLRVMARHATPLIQDIIITNQVRVLGCLEILEDLKVNPLVTQIVTRRVREFEEEFIVKVLAEEEAMAVAGPSVEEALDALLAIGAHIPALDVMPYPGYDDPALEEAVEKSASQDTHARLLKMKVHERIICALRGTTEERSILVNSRNRLIQRSVLASPKLTDHEIEKFAASRSVAEEVIAQIAENRRWTRLYQVNLALAFNPKTPVYSAKAIIMRLNYRDKVRVSRDRNLNPITRQIATKLSDTRRR
jgi:hypothetical protein